MFDPYERAFADEEIIVLIFKWGFAEAMCSFKHWETHKTKFGRSTKFC